MGQCVSRKAGAVIAASGYSPIHRNKMDKKSSKNKADQKKRGAPHTRGTAMSFGFRRRTPATTGIPVPVSNYQQRSKSVGPEHHRRQNNEDDYYHTGPTRYHNYPASGRSTPRLAPPKKDSSGLPIRTNRFGFRTPHQRFTDKVTDLSYNSHIQSGHDRIDQFQNVHQQNRSIQQPNKPRPSPINYPTYNNNINNNNVPTMDANRRIVDPPTSVGKFTLHTTHLPQPQLARMADTTSKFTKTVVNQSRKVGGPLRTMGTCSSKEGSGTEDSGVGSHHGGYSDENGAVGGRSRYDFFDPRQTHIRPRKLGVVLNGKSFDVRDVDDDSTITEISVIPLPKTFASPQLRHASPNLNLNTGLVRERTNQYQRNIQIAKDNRFNDSTTSMSTTSSEGYDEGLGEEKVYKDRSRSEKIAVSTSSSMMRSGDFSAPSSDEQDEFGLGGEAMADEYSISSSEDLNKHQRVDSIPTMPCNIVTQSTTQHFKAISNAAKNGILPNSTLRSVLLTIEDPAFAAVAATTTTLIDDETSPVDSLFDSPTASVSPSDVKPKKEGATTPDKLDDDSPGTPTNASNSLSLSEGREFFDDEIADQPGLVFDETLIDGSTANTEHSLTILEPAPNIAALKDKSVENSPVHARKMNRAGSISTLSSCESLASDDLMMDYERSDASSFGEVNSRGNSAFIMQDLDDANSLLDLEIQGQEAMKEWNSLLSQTITNSANNNVNPTVNNNPTETGLATRTRLLNSRSNSDSPRSLDSTKSRQIYSPLRTPRSIQSPSLDSGDEGSLKIERGTYNYMFQDIVSIKTMLLKLKRVLQEESLTPFENSLKNGLIQNLKDGNSTTDGITITDDCTLDELTILRQQVVLLQAQIEDKDRTIESLQAQLAKYKIGEISLNDVSSTVNGSAIIETINVSTQTDKIRPASIGMSLLPSLSQNSSTGSLVSLNDSSPNLSKQTTPTRVPSSTNKSRHISRSNQRLPPNGQYSPQQQQQQQPQTFQSPDSTNRSSIPAPRRISGTQIPRSARALSTGRGPSLNGV